jgi:hypothetical protein
MGGNQFNMAVDAEFTSRRTSCGREWVRVRSTRPWVLNSQADILPVARMGGNQISMAVGAEFRSRRTAYGQEGPGVEIRSTWPSMLNSQDDALPVGEDRWKSIQHGHRC